MILSEACLEQENIFDMQWLHQLYSTNKQVLI